ncbi:hypothetical protein HPP92_008185 [Vanilla planifolia]|uniref:Uncharacterized protein n=1 Tax=Vanilla planifolia TaxID=51239 RepID=A0A835RDN1_VANPL|nr:hypothetical protein HPP92_008185 [Vanilla planifolia]
MSAAAHEAFWNLPVSFARTDRSSDLRFLSLPSSAVSTERRLFEMLSSRRDFMPTISMQANVKAGSRDGIDDKERSADLRGDRAVKWPQTTMATTRRLHRWATPEKPQVGFAAAESQSGDRNRLIQLARLDLISTWRSPPSEKPISSGRNI